MVILFSLAGVRIMAQHLLFCTAGKKSCENLGDITCELCHARSCTDCIASSSAKPFTICASCGETQCAGCAAKSFSICDAPCKTAACSTCAPSLFATCRCGREACNTCAADFGLSLCELGCGTAACILHAAELCFECVATAKERFAQKLATAASKRASLAAARFVEEEQRRRARRHRRPSGAPAKPGVLASSELARAGGDDAESTRSLDGSVVTVGSDAFMVSEVGGQPSLWRFSSNLFEGKRGRYE